MHSIIKIYVAGPLSTGDKVANVNSAIAMGEILSRLGFYPYIPHLNYYWHLLFPKENHHWLDLDFPYLEICNGLYRMPGYSKGADQEVKRARELDIPVFYNMRDMIDYQWEKENDF